MNLSVTKINGFKPENGSNVAYMQRREKSVCVFDKDDKSNNGKFDASEAGKNFVKGVFSPLTAIIKHPIATAGLLAGTVAACAVVPVLGPIMFVGFGALSVGQLAKGSYDAVKNYYNGDYDNAEKSFDKIGQGFIGTLLTAIGVRQSAQVAKEAKLMSELGTTTLKDAQRTAIAQEVKSNGFVNNLKEIASLFTTKQGLKSVASQFKSTVIKERFTNFINIFKNIKTKNKPTNPQERINKVERFKASAEGQRRAALSDEQIEAEVQSMYDKAFEKLGIPKEKRPKLEIQKARKESGGSYNHGQHVLKYNPEAYKNGIFEMDDVIMHEATHCKEALIRAGIPQERVDAIVQDELISRIMNGESEEILYDCFLGNAKMIKAPKLPAGMKEEFVQLVKSDLHVRDDVLRNNLSDYTNLKELGKMNVSSLDPLRLARREKELAPLFEKLNAMLDNHPEFVSQYSSREEAFLNLTKYAQSENLRYMMFTNTKVPGEGNFILSTTPEEIAHAEKSLVDNITTIEGNGRISGFKAMFASDGAFNQYQFSPEEVLAQKNGNQFLIDNLTAKMQEMRQAGTLSAEDEAYMTGVINRARAVIEFKTKGLEYYEKYTQLLNNPSDKNLEQVVMNLKQELDALKANIDPAEYQKINEIVKNHVLDYTVNIPPVAIYQIISALRSSEK